MSYGSHLACFSCMQQQMYSAGHSLSGSSDRRDAPVCCFPAAADTRLPLGGAWSLTAILGMLGAGGSVGGSILTEDSLFQKVKSVK